MNLNFLFKTIELDLLNSIITDCDNKQIIRLIKKNIKLLIQLRYVNVHNHCLRKKQQ